jgi:hypothetical protein
MKAEIQGVCEICVKAPGKQGNVLRLQSICPGSGLMCILTCDARPVHRYPLWHCPLPSLHTQLRDQEARVLGPAISLLLVANAYEVAIPRDHQRRIYLLSARVCCCPTARLRAQELGRHRARCAAERDRHGYALNLIPVYLGSAENG